MLAILAGGDSKFLGDDGQISNEQELQDFEKYFNAVNKQYNYIKRYELLNEPNKYIITDEQKEWYSRLINNISSDNYYILAGSVMVPYKNENSAINWLKDISSYDEAYKNINLYSYHPYASLEDLKVINMNFKNGIRDIGGFTKLNITEYGKKTSDENDYSNINVQQSIINQAEGVELSVLYQLRSNNGNNYDYGLLNDDYSPKPVYFAMKNFFSNTNGSEYIGTVNLKEGLEAYVYDKDGKPKIIVWSNNSDNEIQIDYTDFTAKNIYGEEIQNMDGKLNITTSPIYLDNISTNYFYQAISNLSTEKYDEFKEKFQEQLQKVPELINKIDNLEKTMENIQNIDIMSEDQAKQLMKGHFDLGNQLIEAYESKTLDIEYVKLSSMLDMLNEIGDSFEDLVTVSAVTRNPDLENTKLIIDNTDNEITNNSDIEIIYPTKILEFSKDLYEKSEYINGLEEENDIKTGLIVSKDLHAKYLAEWAKKFTELYIDKYIQNNPITITYSKTEITNQDVIAILNVGVDCNVTNNNNSNTYTFKSNGEFEFEYTRRGRNFKEKAIVSNIDKTNPKITGLEDGAIYSSGVVFNVEDENFDRVEISLNDSLLENYKMGQKLEEEGIYHIKAIDKAGNTSEITFYIMKDAEDAYQIEEDKIYNVVPDTETQNFSQNLPIKEQYVIKRDDRILEDGEIVATGDILELQSGNKYTLIVKGDVNSDGKVNISDLVRTQNFILGRRTATDLEKEAADANLDKQQITIKDLVRIQIMILNSPTL